MKITIYELLGMIKDGKAPKKIKCFDYNFIYTGDIRPQRFYKVVDQDNYLLRDFVYTLNTIVEIIEPQEHKMPEKIPEKIIIGKKQPVHRIKKIEKKINEIIDYLEEIK